MHTDSDRVFQGESTFPGQEEWFYRAREGIAGPYFNKNDAAMALCRFIKYCQDNGLDGGRAAPAAAASTPGIGAGLARALALAVSALLPGRRRPASRNPSGRLPKPGFKKDF